MASGCTFTDLHYNYRVGISTARKFVEEVCTAIWSVMREECIPTPTCDKWESIASNFESTANFPHCLGAVDGKHIRLTCPFDSGSMYFNYKDYFSIVLMAVADAKYRFVYVDVRSYGKECDSSIFKRSKLWRSIENGSQQLPEEQLLPGTESPKIPYFFVEDEAFGLHKHLLRPFGGNHLTVEKECLTIDCAEHEDMWNVRLAFLVINGVCFIVLSMCSHILQCSLSTRASYCTTMYVTETDMLLRTQQRSQAWKIWQGKIL